MPQGVVRCWPVTDPLQAKYHDEEWGVPVHDDRQFFELLTLEIFQAGLNWWLILKRRDAFRRAFDNFDPGKVAGYTSSDIERIMGDPEIIRNRRKIESTIDNARCFLKVQGEFGSFDAFIWRFVGGKPIRNSPHSLSELAAKTAESTAMSKDLKKRGFKFVGLSVCYSFMEATGLVNDHTMSCFRHQQIKND